MPWSFIKFSQLIHEGNVWRSVWRICMLILGLKGLNKEPGPREWTSLICTPPRRAPLLVPLSSLRWGDMGLPTPPPPPWDWSGLLSRVVTPSTTWSWLPPGWLLSWFPYPKIRVFSLPPKFVPLLSWGVFCLVYCIEQCKTIHWSAQFINLLIFHIVHLCLFVSLHSRCQ